MKTKGISNSFFEIFQRRELVLELTKRQLTASHKGSVLGMFWMILSPLLLLCLYVIVFGFILEEK
jgi:ABC-type polysaccharide/polyol phosphate export permease